jgi:tellurite resistance protein TehA-like permease/glutaredoxin
LLDELIASHKVLLFSKVRDQYCMEVERVLMSLGVAFSIVDVDTLPDMKMVLDRLDTLGGVSTAPHLFVDGTSIGSCNTVKRFEKSLDLHVFLAKYIDREKAKLYEEERIRSLRFLYFPVSVDNRAARVVDVFVFIYAIVCAGTYENPSSKWAVLALAIDLIVRCIGGPEASVQGMIGAYAVSGLRPNFVPGRPKHFSATMSMMLAVIAAVLYLSAGPDYSVKAGGIAVLIILAVGCLISFAFNFDIGVWLYGVAFKLRLTRDDAFRPHIHLLQDKNWEYDFNRDAATFKIFHSQVHNRHVLLPGQTELSEIDLVRKNRLETEFKLQDHSYVRHVKIDLFACPMAIAALAYAFKVTDVSFGNRFSRISLQWGTKLCADALSIISVICFGCILILYLLKCAHYPRKVLKEFHHPVLGSFFIAPSICLVLYGLLMYDFYIEMALILTWFGAFPLMLMSVNVVASLVYDYHSEEVVTPALMMLPVGCFLSSLALSTYGNDIATDDGSVSGINYILVSRLWFAVGALFAFTFFVCTFNASFFKSFADVRERPYLWLWMAASAAAGPAYIVRTCLHHGHRAYCISFIARE